MPDFFETKYLVIFITAGKKKYSGPANGQSIN